MLQHKRRLFYLDWVRALATILIVITHFDNPFLTSHPGFPNTPFGIYIGDLGVSQFLIISGAALMYTYEDEEHLDLRTFFWKRFKSIYPMFWLAFVLANAYFFIVSHGAAVSRAPKRSLILSLLGMDGYLANAGLDTFYTLGEWFLGFIVLFYIIFPVLRYGVIHHPWITVGLGLAMYAATLILHPHLGQMPQNLLLTTRIPELLFGMYFVRYIDTIPHPVALVAVLLLVLQQVTGLVKGSLAVTLVGTAFFLVLIWISRWVEYRPVMVLTGSISKYSYAIFLVHHQVIVQMFVAVPAETVIGSLSVYVLFIVDMLVIAILAVLLQRLNQGTLRYLRSMFSEPGATRQGHRAMSQTYSYAKDVDQDTRLC